MKHSLCLRGDIGVVFYIPIPEATPEACVEFFFGDQSLQVNIDLARYIVDDGTVKYRFACLVNASQTSAEIVGVASNLFENADGDLEWISKSRLLELTMWEGDRIFLKLLDENAPFFDLTLEYHGDRLVRAALNGSELPVGQEET